MLLLILITLFLLLGTASLTALQTILRQLRWQEGRLPEMGAQFFYRGLHRFFFKDKDQGYEGLIFAALCTLNITRFFYGALAFYIVYGNFGEEFYSGLALLAAFLLASLFFGEYLPRFLSTRHPESLLRFFGPIASCYLVFFFPVTFIFLKLFFRVFKEVDLEPLDEAITQTKQEIIELVHRSTLTPELSNHDKKLIESMLTFKERVAREVMVPRVGLFSLPAETSIRKAAVDIEEEGYSRIPIYEDSVDDIIGVVMYKDILKKYMEYESKGADASVLEAPISTIQKAAFYTPETKKISVLLQEFRKKQVHMAIVVDEYGGTEGIVTIEDILEEIVGDISDEYDEDEEPFFAIHGDSWIVDARMNILDAEEQLGIKIPQEGDYETIGGYIVHCTGTIPSKGLVIQQENFEMEIIESDDRKVNRVRIKKQASISSKKQEQPPNL